MRIPCAAILSCSQELHGGHYLLNRHKPVQGCRHTKWQTTTWLPVKRLADKETSVTPDGNPADGDPVCTTWTWTWTSSQFSVSLCSKHTYSDHTWGCLPQPGTKRRGEGILRIEDARTSEEDDIDSQDSNIPIDHGHLARNCSIKIITPALKALIISFLINLITSKEVKVKIIQIVEECKVNILI